MIECRIAILVNAFDSALARHWHMAPSRGESCWIVYDG